MNLKLTLREGRRLAQGVESQTRKAYAPGTGGMKWGSAVVAGLALVMAANVLGNPQFFGYIRGLVVLGYVALAAGIIVLGCWPEE